MTSDKLQKNRLLLSSLRLSTKSEEYTSDFFMFQALKVSVFKTCRSFFDIIEVSKKGGDRANDEPKGRKKSRTDTNVLHG